MGRMLVLVVALGAASIGSGAPAQDKPPRLFTASGPWAMDYADDSCRLIRNFTRGPAQITLALERNQPGPGMDIALSGDGIQIWNKAELAEFTFLPGGQPTTRTLFSSELADGRPYYLLSGANLAGDVDKVKFSDAEWREAARKPVANGHELATAATIDTLSLTKGFKDPTRLALGPMAAPMTAMQTCIDELLTHWGVDAKAHRSLSRRAGPVDPKQLSTAITYPMNAEIDRRDGFVRFRLILDRAGKPTDCVIMAPKGPKEFETTTCRSLRTVPFEPALDASGQAIASYYVGLVRFNALPRG